MHTSLDIVLWCHDLTVSWSHGPMPGHGVMQAQRAARRERNRENAKGRLPVHEEMEEQVELWAMVRPNVA